MAPPRVVIVGAGYTGLVAAYRLARQGSPVTLLERGDDVGGLAGDFRIHGVPVEKAYHFIYRTDVHTQRFLAEMGLADRLVWCSSSISVYHRGRIWPFNTALDLLRFAPLAPADRLRAGLVVLLLQWTRRGWKKLGRITAYEWLRRWAGPAVLDVIWAPLLKGKFNLHYREVSMQWLWGRIQQRADSKRAGEKSEKLGQLRGGLNALTCELSRRLADLGVTVRTRTGVRALVRRGNEVAVELEGGGDLACDRAIFTGPSAVFAKLVAANPEATPEYRARLESIPYLGAVVLVFSSDQEISPYYWHNISEMEWPFLVFINLTRLRSPADFAGKHVYYLAAYVPHEHEYMSLPEEALLELWFGALAKMFPAFDRGKLLERHLFRWRWAQHIVGTGYEKKIPPYRSPVPGIFLANFSQIYPQDRGVNFAIREGERIARLVWDGGGAG